MGQTAIKAVEEEKYNKYKIRDVEHLIEELKDLNLSKDMILLNIQKYGYEADKEYILQRLNNRKIKVKKFVQEQAELFQILYRTDRECFIRLRNKSSGEYRAYNIESLKNPYKLQRILKSDLFKNNVDIMYSLNAFNNMFHADEKSLFSLQNIGIDIDFNTEKYTLNEALRLVKEIMKKEDLQANVIEFGHRIRLIYSIQDVAVTQKSLNLYRKVGKAIAEKFKELNASVQPSTTFARIINSKNSKNDAVIDYKLNTAIKYTLKYLTNKLLPRCHIVKKKSLIAINNCYSLNLARLRDLEKIQQIRPQYKELLCYLYRNYCLLANMPSEEAKERMFKFNAKFPKPKRENKLDGETKNLNRKPYFHRSETILKLTDISYADEEMLHLETIISQREYKRRQNISAKNRYNERLKLDGKMSKREQMELIRQKIKALRQQGFKKNDIMSELNLTESTYRRHFRYLKKNGLL